MYFTYDLDRASAPGDAIQSAPKNGISFQKGIDTRSIVTTTREKLIKLNDFIVPKFTPEESTKEKTRILSILET